MVKFLYLSAGQALYLCLPLVIGVAGLQEEWRRIVSWSEVERRHGYSRGMTPARYDLSDGVWVSANVIHIYKLRAMGG